MSYQDPLSATLYINIHNTPEHMTSLGRQNSRYFLTCKYLLRCQNMYYDSRQKNNNQNIRDKHETYLPEHDTHLFFLLIKCTFVLKIRKETS